MGGGGASTSAWRRFVGPAATKRLVSGMRLCPTDQVDTFAEFNGHHAEWKDDVQSYSNTEPGVDLTASSPLAFSRQMVGRL